MAESVQVPSGTVTLLFTDIQGSTRLWEAEPGPMAAALRRHDEILRAAIESAAGYVFKTVGDAFCAAFWTAEAALASVLASQRSLTGEAWPTSRPVRVRMSLHTGACEERDGDYFGPVVNRAARLEAIAHGGQVLVSGVTAELLSDDLPAGVSLRDLGLHRLKDLGRPEQVFQLEATFLTADFPPLASLDNPDLPNNLPSVLSAFVGREKELSEVVELVKTSRLVTLTGSGGCGKTRLALQASAEALERTTDGVWLAELGPLTDGEQIAELVAGALGLPDHPGRSAGAAVADALAGQDALLVLDNCEHVIDAAAKFCDELMRGCPRVRILATSREPLGIDGEHVYRVPSMTLPRADAESAEDVAASDAARLFTERARMHDPSFTLDQLSVPLVAMICRRLDGIPLALELAAARLSSMSLRQIADRLDQRFRLLTGGSRNALPRQQTLQATVDWSFGLLNQPEREMLIRLSVFAGGFDLEGAESVCATGSVDALDVLDLVGSLVDKSLVLAERTPDSVRYRLLETIRQYAAQELLRAAGDAEVLGLRDRHAGYYLALAEVAGPALRGSLQRGWFRRLDTEWDNMRAAIAHLEAEERAQDICRLCVALDRFAVSRAHREVLASLRRVLGQAEEASEPAAVAEALLTTILLTQFFDRAEAGPLAAASQYADRALAIARQLGDKRIEARSLSVLAGLAFMSRDAAAPQSLSEQAVALARQVGDVHLLGEMLGMQAIATQDADRRAIRLEALGCYRACGDELLAATELHMLYGLDLEAGQIEDAQAHLEEAVALAEPLGDEVFLYFFRSDLGMLRLIQGRHADAAQVVRRCLLAARRTGLVAGVAEVIFGAACCTGWQGHYLKAARLHGAADVEISVGLENRTLFWSPVEQQVREREQAKLRELMGARAYDDGYRAGRMLSSAEAVELALSKDE